MTKASSCGKETLEIMIALRSLMLVKNCEYQREPRPTLLGKQRDRTVQTTPQRLPEQRPAAKVMAPIATRAVEGQAIARAQQPGAAAVRKDRSPRKPSPTRNTGASEETRAKWAAFDLLGQFR